MRYFDDHVFLRDAAVLLASLSFGLNLREITIVAIIFSIVRLAAFPLALLCIRTADAVFSAFFRPEQIPNNADNNDRKYDDNDSVFHTFIFWKPSKRIPP